MLDLIVSDPKTMMGKPVVRGTRITVESIVDRLGSFAAEALEVDVVHPPPT